MGASDVTMPLVTGTTWLKVPQTVLVEFTGTLRVGLVGKDVMLWMLKKFGRNTVALDRCVEFGGDLSTLDIDSRFAICNMVTEFGGLAGIFPGDELTEGFLYTRRPWLLTPNNDSGEEAKYFRADKEAEYFKRLSVDLSEVVPTVAKWPSPDHVFTLDDPMLYVPLYDEDTNIKVCDTIRFLDGCFIGACTTTENEIILAGLLLKVAMEKFKKVPKLRPEKPYKRKITPGSKIMTERLEGLGILDIFRRANFTVGASGCSYCLGIAADRAMEGEVWLSSQNRNFRNRMGRGAIGNVTSAAVVAASSFSMEISDPTELLEAFDRDVYKKMISHPLKEITICEPSPCLVKRTDNSSTAEAVINQQSEDEMSGLETIRGRVQKFGDSIDTDAIIPAAYIVLRGHDQGEKSFCFYRPEFVRRVKEGRTIILAGTGFGCGSSREEAVSCLRFCGVKAVIAKSFSFIFGRNLLTMDLVGICVKDDEFYEEQIYRHAGIINMYRKYDQMLFFELAKVTSLVPKKIECHSACGGHSW